MEGGCQRIMTTVTAAGNIPGNVASNIHDIVEVSIIKSIGGQVECSGGRIECVRIRFATPRFNSQSLISQSRQDSYFCSLYFAISDLVSPG